MDAEIKIFFYVKLNRFCVFHYYTWSPSQIKSATLAGPEVNM